MTTTSITHKHALVQPVQQQADSLVVVTPTEAWTISRLTNELSADPRTEPDWFCRQAAAAAVHLPSRITEQIRRFVDAGSATGILVFRGLQVGDVPPTPLDNATAVGSTTLLAKQLAVLAEFAGDMVAYEAEGNGFLLQDMVPNPRLARAQESQGSKVELEAHTEQMFSPLRPDYVVLGCLKGDLTADTYVFDANSLMSHFTGAEIAAMRESRWTTTIDSSFKPFVRKPDEVRGPWPIISGSQADPTMLIDQDLMSGIDSEAQLLLERVIEVYVAHRNRHNLAPGDVLFLDNSRAMHGRSPFIPRFDGTDRMITRGFVTRDRGRLRPYLARDRRTVLAAYS